MDLSLSLFSINTNSLCNNAWGTPLSPVALPVNIQYISHLALHELLFRWRAAFCICMALSGVTCSPPPPSATIEAIEAIEPHDEDREGKPVLHIPPLSTHRQGLLVQRPPATCQLMHTTAHIIIIPSRKILQDSLALVRLALLFVVYIIIWNRNQTKWLDFRS